MFLSFLAFIIALSFVCIYFGLEGLIKELWKSHKRNKRLNRRFNQLSQSREGNF